MALLLKIITLTIYIIAITNSSYAFFLYRKRRSRRLKLERFYDRLKERSARMKERLIRLQKEVERVKREVERKTKLRDEILELVGVGNVEEIKIRLKEIIGRSRIKGNQKVVRKEDGEEVEEEKKEVENEGEEEAVVGQIRATTTVEPSEECKPSSSEQDPQGDGHEEKEERQGEQLEEEEVEEGVGEPDFKNSQTQTTIAKRTTLKEKISFWANTRYPKIGRRPSSPQGTHPSSASSPSPSTTFVPSVAPTETIPPAPTPTRKFVSISFGPTH